MQHIMHSEWEYSSDEELLLSSSAYESACVFPALTQFLITLISFSSWYIF